MRYTSSILCIACVAVFSGCSANAITDRINPYRIDVRQGNYIDQEMVSQLRKGMTREQVQFVMGRPLVADVFRNDRWDYIYVFRPGRGGEVERRSLSVFFDADGLLERVEGDVVAGDTAAAAQAAPAASKNRVIDIQGPQPKGKN